MKKDSLHVNGYTIIANVKGSAVSPYHVSYDTEKYACSCPAWTQHTPRKNCKHIDRVIAVLNGGKNSTVTFTAEGVKLKAALDNALKLANSI